MGNPKKRRETDDLLDTAERRAFILNLRKSGATYEQVAQAARSGNLEFDVPHGHLKINPDGTNNLQASIVKCLADGKLEILQTPQ